MKKLLFIIILMLTSISAFAQIGVTEFPKIGFGDLYWLHIATGKPSADPNYYYPKLNELGLTYVVSNADAAALSKSNGIKFMDDNLGHNYWSTTRQYARAVGVYFYNNYPYEVGGGGKASIWLQGEGFGFGNSTLYSRWVDPNKATTGNPNYPDDIIWVSYANIAADSQGTLVYLKTAIKHNRKYGTYHVNILAKINNIAGADSNDTVAVVHIYNYTPTPPAQPAVYETSNKYLPPIDTAEATSFAGVTRYIKASDFSNPGYNEIKLSSFYRKGGNNLVVEIEWMATRDLYVDQISIYDSYYKTLYVDNSSSIRTLIGNDISSKYYANSLDSNYFNLYSDEPDPIMYRSMTEVSGIAESRLGAGKNIMGATNALTNYDAVWVNAQRNLPYVLYDLYPIKADFDSATTTANNSIQKAYDRLVQLGGSQWIIDGREVYQGLRTGIELAHKYNNDILDDIPFFHTIQVQAENNVDNNGNIIERRYRAPTPNEILTQGNLAICYGAKGIMYFLITTYAYNKHGYYGLFDEQGNVYDGVNTGIVQDPSAPQIPNERFYAVKKLNQHIDKISNTLLQLTWKEAYSIHLGQPTGEYITVIESYNGSTKDNASETFVELGLFKKTTDYTNDNLDYFYVVNRRSLSIESRNIEIGINKGSSSYQNWIVKEVGSDNSWIINKTDGFRPSFSPGEGKLFKLEPLFLTNATLNGNVFVESNTETPSNRILTISAGTSVFFDSGKKLIINGTLKVQGFSNNKVTFDRSGSGNWYGLFIDGLNASITIEHADIENATFGLQFVNGASGTVSNCTIKNNYYGIYASSSEPLISNNTITNNKYGLRINFAYTPNWDNVDIRNNTIADNQYYGVYIYDSSPHLYNNNIDRNGRGVVLWQNSSPIFDHNIISRSNYYGLAAYGSSTPSLFYSNVNNEGGYNTFIRNGTDGVYAGGSSNPNLGGNSTEFGGYNVFEDNTAYEINNHTSQIKKFFPINAMYNWWGQASGPLTTDFFGNVAYVPYLTSNPLANGSITNVAIELKNGFGNSPSGSIPRALLVALHKQMSGKFKQSAQKFRKFILKNTDSPFIVFAVQQFIKSAKHYLNPNGVNNFISALLNRNISNDVNTELLRNQITFLIYQEKYVEANTRIDHAFDFTDANTDAYYSLLLQKAKLNILFLNDLQEGVTLLNKIMSEADETSEYYLTAELELSNIQLNEPLHKIEVTKNKLLSVKEYSLAQNYPNPFNPSTNINYTIQQDGAVTLKVYDILGAEVMTLVNKIQVKGSYTVNFDASKLANGVYVYRIMSGNYVSSKKMILLK